MLVGVPRGIKDNEYRVGLVPSTVRNFPLIGTAARRSSSSSFFAALPLRKVKVWTPCSITATEVTA